METGQSLGAQPDPSAAVRMHPFDAYLQTLASKELSSGVSGGSDTSSGSDRSVELRRPGPRGKSILRRKKEAGSEYTTGAGASTGSDPTRTSLDESIKSDKRRLRLRQQELDRFEAGHLPEQAFHYSMTPTELHNYLEKNVIEATTLLQKHQYDLYRRIRSGSPTPNTLNTQKSAQQIPAHQTVTTRDRTGKK